MVGILNDKVALVTGGGSGIGQATSLIFAREGAKVVVADVNSQGGEETVSKIKDAGGNAIYVHADVSKASDVEAMIATAVDTYGSLDCAHNNAGIGRVVGGSRGLTHEYSEDAWDGIMSINLKGVWLCMKYEIPQMLSQGGGSIVNTASAVGLVGHLGQSVYVASKHGVIGLTKTAALEYAQEGLRVNAVCPGWTDTAMTNASSSAPDRRAYMLSKQPIGRIEQPEEVAEAVIWLCSEKASFVTGHAMAIDGGWTAQ